MLALERFSSRWHLPVASATQVAAAFLTATLWSEGGDETRTKTFAAFGIVAFAGWLATPVLERALRRAD